MTEVPASNRIEPIALSNESTTVTEAMRSNEVHEECCQQPNVALEHDLINRFGRA
jgi:hypothetical protein